MSLLWQILVNGILLGGLYALMALGLALIWGVLNIVNLAHGALIMLGAYVCYYLFTELNLDPLLTVMVEMKCAEYAPHWLAPIIMQLGLQRTSFSKYVASMRQDSFATDLWAPVLTSADGDR